MKARLLLMVILIPVVLEAQVMKKVPAVAQKRIEKVRTAVDQMNWKEALDLSDKLVKQYPDWPAAWQVRAESWQGSGDPDKAAGALRQLIRIDSTGFPEAYRWIADAAFRHGNYEEAAQFLKRFNYLSPVSAGRSFSVQLLDSSIRFSLGQIRKPVEFPGKVKGGVNTAADEYFPSLSIDGSVLAFTRQWETPGPNGEKTRQEDLLYALRVDSAYPDPVLFPYPINTAGNEGTQSLRQDGRIMFLTACNRPDSKGSCDIYYCVKAGDHWSDPVNMGYPVNSRYWESTPFLAQDGKRLIFASNRPGGYGGMDLWQSFLGADSTWSKPVNLGSIINTPMDEMSPFLLPDGNTLFFASNGHPGLGGFDLFICSLERKSGKGKPVNLGYGINSHFDEIGLTINADQHLGLFASNRDTTAGQDIYQVDMKPFIPVETTVTLSGTVIDRVTRNPLGARIEVQPHGDTLVSRVEADPVNGSFLLGVPVRSAYRIGASYPGYLPYSYYYLTDSTRPVGRIRHSIEMEPLRTGAAIILQNIFFAFDSFKLLPESDPDLREILSILRANPGMIIEISGYTDSTGSDEYNLNLSQKRAESVRNYLMDNGVKADRVIAKGYGRSNPIDSNKTEEGRSRNRRTEMKVIRTGRN